MSRGKKLLIVGCVLAVGLVLAWPFRKSGMEPRPVAARSAPPVEQPNIDQRPLEPPTIVAAPQRSLVESLPLESPAPPVAAQMTSIGQSQRDQSRAIEGRSAPTASFDLANHPALAGTQAQHALTNSSHQSTASSPVTPPEPPNAPVQRQQYTEQQHAYTAQSSDTYPQPAYETIPSSRQLDRDTPAKEQVRHIVQNSDTLEKLAKRYLGDEGRALEIFDLNRDVLDNPLLLPINAELRIPIAVRKQID